MTESKQISLTFKFKFSKFTQACECLTENESQLTYLVVSDAGQNVTQELEKIKRLKVTLTRNVKFDGKK